MKVAEKDARNDAVISPYPHNLINEMTKTLDAFCLGACRFTAQSFELPSRWCG
jgi:hypothetical protein